MIACDASHCGDQYNQVGQLAAHRIAFHGSRPAQALCDARLLFGLETRRPEFADLSGVRDPHFDVAPKPTRPRGRPRSLTMPVPVERARALTTTSERAACKYCVRVAPEKCRRHGGPSHSSSVVRVGPEACKSCAISQRRRGLLCAQHGGPKKDHLYRRVTAKECGVCRRMRAKDGQDCARHGGPVRGTAWHQRARAMKVRSRSVAPMSL
jgi:hypothetical protein